jgi:hypothetical protein
VSPQSGRRDPRPRGDAMRRTPRQRHEARKIYVVAEGETEYDYLSHLDREYGERRGFRLLVPGPAVRQNGLKPDEIVLHAKTKASDKNIDEVWAFFDHDCRTNIAPVYAGARRAGISVAFSHPAFELWLLLHFRNFATPQGGRNTHVIQALRNADRATFGQYDHDNKRITTIRFAALTRNDGINQAVRHARALDDHCPMGCCSGGDPATDGHPADRCDPNMRDPSTGVWRLIERLGISNLLP